MKIMIELRTRYLEGRGKAGGTASGFREYVRDCHRSDPRVFPVDLLRDEAATKAWEANPRNSGADLFSINGVVIPDVLTRPHVGFADDDDDYDKVSTTFATLGDLREDAIIKMRNAARASAAAEERMKQFDEGFKRAKGDLSALLSSLKD